MSKQKSLLVLSIDIEATGPVPGLYSMISLGVAGFIQTKDNQKKVVYTFEGHMKELEEAKQDPDTMKWWKTQIEAWEYITSNQKSPEIIMQKLENDIQRLKERYDIITIGKPISFDWSFVVWYFHKFCGNCPLGFSARDITSYYWGMTTIGPWTPRGALLKYEDKEYKHTHKALDDALEQGAIFMNMMLSNKK